MLAFILVPRNSEINSMGHVGNATLPIWFEEARLPILNNAINMTSSPDSISFRLRQADYDYERELVYGDEVEIRSSIKDVEKTSVTFYQEVWQKGHRAAVATTMLHFFDPHTKNGKSISEIARNFLKSNMD